MFHILRQRPIYAMCWINTQEARSASMKSGSSSSTITIDVYKRQDMNYAWPTAEIAVMGGAGAVEVLYARCLLYTSRCV